MIKNIFASVYAAAVLSSALIFGSGCGAADDFDAADDAADDSAELGTVEEAVTIGNGGDGFANTTTQLRCAQPGLSGQQCFIPAANNKTTVSYCFAGFSAAEMAAGGAVDFMSQGIEQIDAQLGTWKLFPTQFPCDITIQKGAIATGTSPVLENYVKMTATGTFTPLTSGAGASHVNGTWMSFTKLSVVVDLAKQTAQGLPGSQNWFYFGGAIAARYVGLGAQNDTANGGQSLATRRALEQTNVLLFNTGLSAGEVCRAENTTNALPGQIQANVGCAGF